MLQILPGHNLHTSCCGMCLKEPTFSADIIFQSVILIHSSQNTFYSAVK